MTNGREILHKMKVKVGFCSSAGDDDDDIDNRGEKLGKGKGRIIKNNHNHNISHGSYLVKGKTSHPMEDYLVAVLKRIKEHELGLFAIFDGHLGHDVANFLQLHLFHNILKEADFWSETRRAIKRAYKKTDEEILDKVKQLGKGGSTAVTAILIDGHKLIVANVGDSRAVLCKDGAAEQLSVDHEPAKERRQIESRGGFVTNIPGDVPRVDGQLAVARAFGDKSLKLHLSSEPDVEIRIVDETTEFLILASDGIWKVLTNQEAVESIRHIKDANLAAKRLIEEAVSRKSRDDISCIVVRFQ